MAMKEEEKEELSFDEMFKLKPEVFTPTVEEEEELEVDQGLDKKKKKAKKKGAKYREIEYDPDRDIIITRKKHKRGDDDWDEL